MRYHQLGDSELRVSEVCLGTMTFGQQNTPKQAHEQLDHAFARGVNFIDTAEMYPVPPRAATQGTTESIVGEWLAKQSRDKLVLATKIAASGRPDGSCGIASPPWTRVRGGPGVQVTDPAAALATHPRPARPCSSRNVANGPRTIRHA